MGMRVGETLKDNDITFKQRKHEIEKLNKQDQETWDRERANASKSPFGKDWAQLNKKQIIHLIKASQENPSAMSVLLFFIEHADRMNALVVSYKALQEILGLSQATIARSIKYLKDKGFVYIYKSGSSNVYVLNNQLVWSNYGNKISYCKFPANIMLTASEQEEIIKNDKLKFDYEKVINESPKPNNSSITKAILQACKDNLSDEDLSDILNAEYEANRIAEQEEFE